jgi:hypothetical protein
MLLYDGHGALKGAWQGGKHFTMSTNDNMKTSQPGLHVRLVLEVGGEVPAENSAYLQATER